MIMVLAVSELVIRKSEDLKSESNKLFSNKCSTIPPVRRTKAKKVDFKKVPLVIFFGFMF
jgi:hypothetical protein